MMAKACLVPRPHYCARPMRFGSRGPKNFSPKCIDWEGLGRRRTGTRLGSVHTNPDIFETACFFDTNWPSVHAWPVNSDTKTALFSNRSAEPIKTLSTRWIRIKSKRFQTDFQIRVNMAWDGECGITITSLALCHGNYSFRLQARK